MFTGIIEDVGEIEEIGAGLLRVSANRIVDGTKPGDSVAIDGVDLTVTEIAGSIMSFNVMPETYRMTALARFGRGSRVNLERSLRAGDRFSGHIVRGVVEGTGHIESMVEDGDAIVVTYSAPEALLASMVERGPVCVNGASLTVIAKTSTTFSASIVRYTQSNTTITEGKVGDPVNIETDVMMRYVQQALRDRGIAPQTS
jgi:riboflavin synthase